jgi:hypothetical protein
MNFIGTLLLNLSYNKCVHMESAFDMWTDVIFGI